MRGGKELENVIWDVKHRHQTITLMTDRRLLAIMQVQLAIRTEGGFLELAHPHKIATLCASHCSTCVA
jgi:hypothetical protein